MKQYDVIIIGAGAAGLSAAKSAQTNHKSVLVLDMGNHPGRKIMVSGGGKCNITNLAVGPDRYFGENKNFVRGALSRVTPHDILQWCQEHNLDLYEKTPGRYFCATGAKSVLDALIQDLSGTEFKYNEFVTALEKQNDVFYVMTSGTRYCAKSVIIATGGISFATMGVSGVGYEIAQCFGHSVVPVRPGLCAIATDKFSPDLSGISIHVDIYIGKEKISDDMLFTHFGVGGPAIYRTTVRDITNGIIIDMCPGVDIAKELKIAKRINGRRSITNVVAQYLPLRLARFIIGATDSNIADMRDADIYKISEQIQSYKIDYSDIKLHDLNSAEIVCGGVSTDKISSKTMESILCPGLFFAGEVMDVSGDLGGFNLHWAWASGYIAGQNA